jgi:hypothetical protein
MRGHVSEIVEGEAYLERIVEAILKKGLRFGAWIVYCYNHNLASRYPEFAKHDAFGNPYLAQVSVAPEDVREYFLAMTRDVVERFRPDSVHVESLHRLNYSYGFQNPKVLTPIPPQAESLLGLCFNPASKAVAAKAGLDADQLQRDVAAWLRPRLERIPRKEDMAPASSYWIAGLFDGRLKKYLDANREHTTRLWLDVAGVIQKGGARVQTTLVSPDAVARIDLDPRIHRHIGRATIQPGASVEEARRQLGEGGVAMVSTQPARFSEAQGLVEQVHAAARAGAGGCNFYNYGLLREEHLRFIGQALSTM